MRPEPIPLEDDDPELDRARRRRRAKNAASTRRAWVMIGSGLVLGAAFLAEGWMWAGKQDRNGDGSSTSTSAPNSSSTVPPGVITQEVKQLDGSKWTQEKLPNGGKRERNVPPGGGSGATIEFGN